MPGLAALVALIFSFRAVKATDAQLRIAEQGQITDRYNTAITNLGSRSIDVRLGGVYALQRLMHDSTADQPTVIAVLCAFVRDQTASTTTTQESQTSRVPTDVQAALTVVGTRNTANDGHTTVVDFNLAQLANVQLAREHLSGADFSGANLTGANLTAANLTAANLTHANLTHAKLEGANLTHTNLTGAKLTGANLNNAKLTSASFTAADLTGAILYAANLTRADLGSGAPITLNPGGGHRPFRVFFPRTGTGANLTHADLTGANLTGAKLFGAHLIGAIWPRNVPAPAGWVRESSSDRLSRAK